MTTDFLDRLEADLREAAERRGQPRRCRPRPTRALRLVAAAAALALLVLGGARLVDRDTTERTARPTPTPTPESGTMFRAGEKLAVATSGDPSALPFFTQPLGEDFTVIGALGRRPSADPSLGTVVLYRPGWEQYATVAARALKVDDVRPMTAADERQLHMNLRGAGVVAVFGADLEERLLERSRRCTPAGRVTGGELSLCEARRDGVSLHGFLVDGRRLPVPSMSQVGHWQWAAASPDGRTILATWSAECETRSAFLIDAEGGTPRALGPASAESVALGWSTDGSAIVFFPKQPACGGDWKPGTYVVSADGKQRTRVLPATGTTPPIEPSVTPRDIGVVTVAP